MSSKFLALVGSSAVGLAAAGKGEVKARKKLTDKKEEDLTEDDWKDNLKSKQCANKDKLYEGLLGADKAAEYNAIGICFGRYVTEDNIDEEVDNRVRNAEAYEKFEVHLAERLNSEDSEASNSKRGKVLDAKKEKKDVFFRGPALVANMEALQQPVVKGKDDKWFDGDAKEYKDKKVKGDTFSDDNLPSTGSYLCTQYTATVYGEVKTESIGGFELKERVPELRLTNKQDGYTKILREPHTFDVPADKEEMGAKLLKEKADLDVVNFDDLKKDGKKVNELDLYWGGPVDSKFYGRGGEFRTAEEIYLLEEFPHRDGKKVPPLDSTFEESYVVCQTFCAYYCWLWIVLGCVAGVGIGIAVFFVVRRRNVEDSEEEEDDEEGATVNTYGAPGKSVNPKP